MPDQAAISPKVVTVMLDRERTICYNKRAEYRMGTLDKPFDVFDFQKTRRSYAALVAWLWASLSERDALDFPTPEALAPHVNEENLHKCFVAFVETWSAVQPAPPESKRKNG